MIRGPLSPAELLGCKEERFSVQIACNIALHLNEALKAALQERDKLNAYICSELKTTGERFREQSIKECKLIEEAYFQSLKKLKAEDDLVRDKLRCAEQERDDLRELFNAEKSLAADHVKVCHERDNLNTRHEKLRKALEAIATPNTDLQTWFNPATQRMALARTTLQADAEAEGAKG